MSNTKVKKWAIYPEKINHLGHVIWLVRLELSKGTTAAIPWLKWATFKTKLRSFLRFCNVFRISTSDFWRNAGPLQKKLRNDQHHLFPSPTADEKNAVKNLKKVLSNLPILALLRASGQYTVDTEAYKSQVRWVLLQQQEDGTFRPIRY